MAELLTSPPPPADVQAQMAGPSPALLQQVGGAGMPQASSLVSMLRTKLQQLEQVTAEMMPLLETINPSAMALLVPIAHAGNALKQQIAEEEQRQSQGGVTPIDNSMMPTGYIPARAAA